MQTISQLINILPQVGRVTWIGIRPEKNQPMRVLTTAQLHAGRGLEGDRYSKYDGNRQITLIQAEHIEALASLIGRAAVDPSELRRNIVVRGLNLLALKDKHFRVGNVACAYSGLCHPCSKMEKRLGSGAYNAMRGHGGINAKVMSDGEISLDSEVVALPVPD